MNTKLREPPVEELVEALWDSIAEELPTTPEQNTELDRRLAAYELDKNRGRLAPEVLADVRRHL